ncbi:MAG: hypothetical protein NCW75_13335 [Phycisphaera sp.]|nr:MAG: hypothetical protein NCW75_13335 [Phycisphaera sp.]
MWQAGVSVGVVLLAAGLALGQNALGDGYALDRNSRIGGQGINTPTRDLMAEIRFRNALVTGNVPGGVGFRDETGYGLAYDFRQRVGSDDLFTFRRDSFTSGLAGTGIRGTEALQYQFALTVGNAPPRNLRGSLLTSRTGERVTMDLPSSPIDQRDLGGGNADLRQATASEMGEYEPGTVLSLRSISAHTAGRSLGPSMLTIVEGEGGLTQGLVASPLRGLAREDLLGDTEAGGREPGDPVRPGTDAGDRGVGEPNPAPGPGVERELREKLAMDYASRIPGSVPVAEPGAQGAAAMGGGDPFLEQLAALQQVLREGVLAEPGGAAADGTEAGGEPGSVPEAPASQRAMARQISGWKELVGTLKEGVGTVEVPAATLDRASAYDLHVNRAKDMLTASRFFEAEQRFTMALAARPGDAIASIGRVHAQIGAGLDLSAAVNLRAFLVEHPEFVGARYEPGMLPSEDRLEIASRRLSELLDADEVQRPRRESALLLAYVSFHRGDRVSTILGLERLGEGEIGRRDPLTPLLRAVWLDDVEAGVEADAEAGADAGKEESPSGDDDGQ